MAYRENDRQYSTNNNGHQVFASEALMFFDDYTAVWITVLSFWGWDFWENMDSRHVQKSPRAE